MYPAVCGGGGLSRRELSGVLYQEFGLGRESGTSGFPKAVLFTLTIFEFIYNFIRWKELSFLFLFF